MSQDETQNMRLTELIDKSDSVVQEEIKKVEDAKKKPSKPKPKAKQRPPSMKDIGTKRITEEERKIPKTFTVERGVYEQFVSMCQKKGVTASSAVNDLIKMYVEGSK